MSTTTITLPADTELTLDFRRQLLDLSWTGNRDGENFHLTFASKADFDQATQRLAALKASPQRKMSRRELRLKMEADRKAEAEREQLIRAKAANLAMDVIAIGETKVALAVNEAKPGQEPEYLEILLYRIDDRYLQRNAWTPGPCIAKLQRQDLDSAEFEALGVALTR